MKDKNKNLSIQWKNRNPDKYLDNRKIAKIDEVHFPSKMTNGVLNKKTGIRSKPKPKKQFTDSNSFSVHDEIFWIVKKKPDGGSSIFYHAYNVDTRNHMLVRETKSEIMKELLDNYMKYVKYDF